MALRLRQAEPLATVGAAKTVGNSRNSIPNAVKNKVIIHLWENYLSNNLYAYSSVLNKNPVFLFGTSAWTKFQCCLKSTVLVLGSSNFGFMSSFPFLISFDNEQGYCPAKSWVLIAWMSPRMLIRSGLLLRTLQYVVGYHWVGPSLWLTFMTSISCKE